VAGKGETGQTGHGEESARIGRYDTP